MLVALYRYNAGDSCDASQEYRAQYCRLFVHQPVIAPCLRPKAAFVCPKTPDRGKVDEGKGLGKVERG